MKSIAGSYKKVTILLSIVLFIVIMDALYRNVFVSLLHIVTKRFVDTDFILFIDQAVNLYRTFIAFTSVKFLHLFSIPVEYIRGQNMLVFNNHQYLLTNQLGYLKNLYVIILLCIYPFPLKKLIVFIFGGLLTTSVLIAMRLALISSMLYNERIVIVIFDMVYMLVLLTLFYYKIHKSYPLRRSYVVNQQKLTDTVFTSSLKTILIGLISFSFISEIIMFYAGTTITHLLLFLTKEVMTVAGFITHISSYSIRLDQNLVYVGISCLGIRLMVMFATVIIFLKGTIQSKVLFILSGVISIFIINVLRIAYVLYHLHKYQNLPQTMTVHDMYDYAIYVFTIILWFIYAKWSSSCKGIVE